MGLKDSSLLTNGWAKFPSGLIMQWGMGTTATNIEKLELIKFPIAFPNACLSINTSVYLASSANIGDFVTQISTFTKTDVTIRHNSVNTASGSSTAFFLAIGY